MTVTLTEHQRAADGATDPGTFRRVLVATAGQANTSGALRLAGELRRRHGAEVTAVTVYQPQVPLPLHQGEVPHLDPSQQQEIDRQSSIVQRQLAEVNDQQSWPLVVLIGEHGRRIVEEGTRWNADLIVLGIGRSRSGERSLGDRALLRVAYGADRPLLAVCPTLDHLPTSVVIAVGRNGEFTRLAQLVAGIAADGASIHLVHVREPGEDEEVLRHLDAALGWVESELRQRGFQVHRANIPQGDPMRRLMAYSRRVGAELVAGGLHGGGFAARTVIRNLLLHLAAASRCSVLLVPRSEP
jgi:nucleotide-binding universal stress UspA family protein